MKAFLKLCAFCLITFILVSPALVIWKVWQSHSDMIIRQRLVSSGDIVIPDGSLPSDSLLDLPNDLPSSLPSNFTMPAAALPSLSSAGFMAAVPAQQQFRSVVSTAIIPVYLGFVGAVLLGFYSGLLLNDRYRMRRHRTLKQQVAILERIWQQSLY